MLGLGSEILVLRFREPRKAGPTKTSSPPKNLSQISSGAMGKPVALASFLQGELVCLGAAS